MDEVSVGLMAAFAGLLALTQALVKLVEKLVTAWMKKSSSGGGSAVANCPLKQEDRDRILRVSDGQKRMEGLMSDSLIEQRASKGLLKQLVDGQKERHTDQRITP